MEKAEVVKGDTSSGSGCLDDIPPHIDAFLRLLAEWTVELYIKQRLEGEDSPHPCPLPQGKRESVKRVDDNRLEGL